MSFFGKSKKRALSDKKRTLRKVTLIHIIVIAMTELKKITKSVVKRQYFIKLY